MSKPLVVVESPTKVRTIKKYLGNDYNVAATVGHIKDLPNKEMGIDVDNGFKPIYQFIPGKQKVIKTLKQAAGDTNDIFLAPDPDREGEAIAWHTAEVLKKKACRSGRLPNHFRRPVEQSQEGHRRRHDRQDDHESGVLSPQLGGRRVELENRPGSRPQPNRFVGALQLRTERKLAADNRPREPRSEPGLLPCRPSYTRWCPV